MAKHIGLELNADLMQKLKAGAFYREGGLAMPLITLDDQGWPHVAITAGAVAARSTEVWVAIGANTGTRRQIERNGRVTLVVAGPGTLYYIKGHGHVVHPAMQAIPQEAAVRVKLAEVSHDMQPYLAITGGISYGYNMLQSEYKAVMAALLDELQAYAEGTDHADRSGH